MKKIISTIFILVVVFGSINIANARSGCCSSHGGVCGCGCCDGTSLSATCAPYYPECNRPVYQTPTPAPVIIPAPTAPKIKVNINSDTYIDANYYDVCRLKNNSDKYLYRHRGQNYYDSQCSLLVDSATEKFVVNNSLANTSSKIHYWAYILLKYKNSVK